MYDQKTIGYRQVGSSNLNKITNALYSITNLATIFCHQCSTTVAFVAKLYAMIVALIGPPFPSWATNFLCAFAKNAPVKSLRQSKLF